MSHYMTLTAGNLFINRRYHKTAVARLKAALPFKSLSPHQRQDQTMRDLNAKLRRENLLEELRLWYFEPTLDEDYNVVAVRLLATFMPDRIDQLFLTLAPYVAAGGEVEVTGEYGDRYKWTFDGKRVTRLEAPVPISMKTEYREVRLNG